MEFSRQEYRSQLPFPPAGGSSWPSDQTCVSCTAGGFFTTEPSVQFSRSVMSDSLRPRGLQHARPPCPPPTPRVYSNSYPLHHWCHPTISSVVAWQHQSSTQTIASALAPLYPIRIVCVCVCVFCLFLRMECFVSKKVVVAGTSGDALFLSLSSKKESFATWESRRMRLRESMPWAKAHTTQQGRNPVPTGSQTCVLSSPTTHPFPRPGEGKGLVQIKQQKLKKEGRMLLSLYRWGTWSLRQDTHFCPSSECVWVGQTSGPREACALRLSGGSPTVPGSPVGTRADVQWASLAWHGALCLDRWLEPLKSLLQEPDIEGVELRRPAERWEHSLARAWLSPGTLPWGLAPGLLLHHELGGDPVDADEWMAA